MERERSLPDASLPRDAPPYDYGSFSGYPSSFSSYHQHPSLDTAPINRNSRTVPISSDSHGGSAILPSRGYPKDLTDDRISASYSYTSSYDDVIRRYGYGSDAGSSLRARYTGGYFDAKSAYDEAVHGPSAALRTSALLMEAGKPGFTFEGASGNASEQWLADRFQNKIGHQKNDIGYMNKADTTSYEQPVSEGWQSSEREYSYTRRGCNARHEDYSSVFCSTQDQATVIRNDNSIPSGSHLPSSGLWRDWSYAGIQNAQPEPERKGSSSLSGLSHDDLRRIASSSRYLDGGTYTGLKDYNDFSLSASPELLVARQKDCESGLLSAYHVAKTTDSKQAAMQGQGVAMPKSVNKEKKRRSRWGPEIESAKGSQDASSGQKKKSRWSAEESPAKEVTRPDISTELTARGSDIVALRARLFVVEQMLLSGKVLDKHNGERSPSPEPVYDNFGFQVNKREQRAREKLNKERQSIIAALKEITDPSRPADGKLSKLSKKVYIPVDKYPDYNFIGLIIGPRGKTQKQMEKESGARIFIRGKGSTRGGTLPPGGPEETDGLHVFIEADNEDSIRRAAEMVEKLLVPVADAQNEHKQAQLRELASLNGTLREDDICLKCKEKGHIAKDCHKGSSTSAGQKGGVATGSNIATVQKGSAAAGSELKNDPLKIVYEDTVLHVESLPASVDNAQLSHLFSPFGKIVHVEVVRHPTTRLSQSYGYVKFLNAVDAAQALALMNGYQVDGKILVVKFQEKAGLRS